MNRCDECKHKDNCACIPYGCECFELDLEEHDKQIKAEVIDEQEDIRAEILCEICKRYHIALIDMNMLVDDVLEQLKEQK